ISTRLSRGMSTPAMRAMPDLPLPLLVLGVVADHPDSAVALDDLAAVTHLLDRCSHLHVARSSPPGSSPAMADMDEFVPAPNSRPSATAHLRARHFIGTRKWPKQRPRFQL